MKNQNDNQVPKKSTGSNMLIIVLILIMLATSAFGIFAWARYQTSVQGEGTAQVAKWNFKVTGDKTQTEQIVFPVTRTDENTTVEEGTIAPGTYGEIPIEIDVTGTQTDLMYTISGSTVNMPRNLKLYSDAARTEEIVVLNQQFSKGNYLKVADIGTETKIISETIYWEWPFETGDTQANIQINNEEDTEDMGKAMTMAITVEGKQLNDTPVLADLVQVGDYVNYNASSNGEQTFTSENCLEGTSVSATISTADKFAYDEENEIPPAQWRVLSVDKTKGIVELMSTDPTAQTVTLSGGDGFVNAETVLNNIGAIYGNGKGGNGGRSINVKDIEQYSSYNPYTFENKQSSTGFYGGIREYTRGNYFYTEKKDDEGSVIGYETTIIAASSSNPIRMTQTYYNYTAQSYFKNSVIYNMLFKNSMNISKNKYNFWLASRCVFLNSDNCAFGVRRINNGRVVDNGLYNSIGDANSPDNRVIPVVSLKTNIQTIGKVNNVWQLDI